jgi:hypothetical protein
MVHFSLLYCYKAAWLKVIPVVEGLARWCNNDKVIYASKFNSWDWPATKGVSKNFVKFICSILSCVLFSHLPFVLIHTDSLLS